MLDDIERMYRMSVEAIEAATEGVDKMLPRTGPGTHRPTNYELAMWVGQVLEAYPPVPMQDEEGNLITASPYLIALRYTEGGPALLKRIQVLFEEAV